jgi:MSHA biogenesis protein MshL
METFSIKLMTLATLLCLSSCATTEPQKLSSSTVNKMQKTLNESVLNNAKAPTAAAVNDALLPPLKIDLPPSSQKKLDPRFDLVINNAPANQVLMGIVSGTRYSMLVSQDVNTPISLNLKDVTIFEALDSIRQLYGYEYKVEGTRIFIEPETMQTRVFQVNYIVGKRSGTSDTNVTSGSMSQSGGSNANGANNVANNGTTSNMTSGNNSAQTISSSIKTTSDSNFWDDLQASITGLVGAEDGRKVVLNTQSGLIMVRAMPKEIRDVENFLRIMQVNIERQVILEAKILNVELNENSQSGVNWSVFGRNGSTRATVGSVNTGTTLSTTGGNISNSAISGTVGDSISNLSTTALGGPIFALALQGANFSALLNFLESQGDVQVLSSPRIATINNQKAVLKVGTDEFFVTNVQQNTVASVGATTTSPSVTLQPFFSGIALDVTPQIDKDDNIILHMHPSISNVTTVNKQVNLGSSGSLNLPLASNSVSETDSIVRTRDGNVIAIGGLMTESSIGNSARVPGLSNIKGIGEAFKQRGNLTKKTELVILLKATVVQGQESWNQDMLASERRFNRLNNPQANITDASNRKGN